MKLTPYLILIFTTAILAVPAPAPQAAPAVDADVLAFMNEVAPLLSTAEFQEPQLPTKTACYTACDAGARDFRAFCAIVPPTPVRVACFIAADALGTPVGGNVCPRFCNILP